MSDAKLPITAQQAACLSLLLYGETGNAVARILGVTPGTVSHWRQKLEALGLIGPPGQAAGGRPRSTGAARKSAPAEPEDDALSYLPPEARHWLRQGWGEFAERERATQAAGTDYFSRNRPDRKLWGKRRKKGRKDPIDRLDSDAGTE